MTQFNNETDFLDLIVIVRAQAEQAELYADDVKTEIVHHNTNLFCQALQPNPRLVVAENLRKGIFDLLHEMCHPEIRANTRIINTLFFLQFFFESNLESN